MSIIDDLKQAVEKYETDSCKTEIKEFNIASGDGAVLNQGDSFRFKVKVTNHGHLDMTNVRVRVNGTSYADVGVDAASVGNSALSSAFNLDAHQVHTTSFFAGKAKVVTGGPKNIVTARIASWDASFNHILIDHATVTEAEEAQEAEGKLETEIFRT